MRYWVRRSFFFFFFNGRCVCLRGVDFTLLRHAYSGTARSLPPCAKARHGSCTPLALGPLKPRKPERPGQPSTVFNSFVDIGNRGRNEHVVVHSSLATSVLLVLPAPSALHLATYGLPMRCREISPRLAGERHAVHPAGINSTSPPLVRCCTADARVCWAFHVGIILIICRGCIFVPPSPPSSGGGETKFPHASSITLVHVFFFSVGPAVGAGVLYFMSEGLCEEQRHVLDLVLSGKSVFFTGAAGTGKSFLLKKLHQVQTS